MVLGVYHTYCKKWGGIDERTARRKTKKPSQKSHTRLDVNFFLNLFSITKAPITLCTNLLGDKIFQHPTPPLLPHLSWGPMIDITPAHPVVNKRLPNHSNPSHPPSAFGYSWVGPSKNGGEAANQGGKDLKQKANGTHQDCFSNWV